MEGFDVRELLAGRISRLSHTYRFMTSPVNKRESVAEHTYATVLYSLFIGRWVEARRETWTVKCKDGEGAELWRRELVATPIIDMAALLERATLHDLEECRTGDLIRPFKHVSTELSDAVNYAASVIMRKILASVVGEGATMRAYYRSWMNSKDPTPEGRIVMLADFMSVLGHMWWEIRTGNFALWEEQEMMLEYSQEFDGESFEFLRPIVMEVQEITRQLFLDPHVQRMAQLCGRGGTE